MTGTCSAWSEFKTLNGPSVLSCELHSDYFRCFDSAISSVWRTWRKSSVEPSRAKPCYTTWVEWNLHQKWNWMYYVSPVSTELNKICNDDNQFAAYSGRELQSTSLYKAGPLRLKIFQWDLNASAQNLLNWHGAGVGVFSSSAIILQEKA